MLGPCALRSPNPKRRGATLPAALQNAGRDDFAERDSVSRGMSALSIRQRLRRAVGLAKRPLTRPPFALSNRPRLLHDLVNELELLDGRTQQYKWIQIGQPHSPVQRVQGVGE